MMIITAHLLLNVCIFDDNQEKLYELKKNCEKRSHTLSRVACIKSHNCDQNHRHESLVSLKISLSTEDAIE